MPVHPHPAVETDDEYRFLADAAAAHGIDPSELVITRTSVQARHGRVSALRYGTGDPETVLVHGGGLNAHTWDLVATALGTPAIAVDLPGHGHSDRLPDYAPRRLGAVLAEVLPPLAPAARLVVGMSLGGMAALAAAPSAALVLVDVCPGSRVPPDSTLPAVMGTPPAPFEEFLTAVAAASHRRVSPGLRHSVWHATRPRQDGTRTWRTDPALDPGSFTDLWPDLERLADRTTAVLATQGSFVAPDDRARLERLLPVVRIDGASHAVQSSRPRELADLLSYINVRNSRKT